MQLLEVSVELDDEAAEAVSTVFNQYGRGGAVIEDTWPLDDASPHQVRAKAYLCTDDHTARSCIDEALWHLRQVYPIPEPTWRRLDPADWAEAWKVGYGVQRVGRRITIKPSWKSHAASPGQLVIELDPGLAFGTGVHPSTRLCLRALEQHVRSGCRVLDVGTGSGILAIAAARLGASRITAMDIDPVSLQVAGANLQRNGVTDRVELIRATLAPVDRTGLTASGEPCKVFNQPGAFDLIVMNILPDVIARSAGALAACLAPGGVFVVSGIIREREGFVREALAHVGLTVDRRLAQSSWVALVGTRDDSTPSAPAQPAFQEAH